MNQQGDNTGALGGPAFPEPNRDQLEVFVNAIFRYAGSDGVVSLRSFVEGDAKRPFRISPISLAGGLPFLIDAAEDDARRAAMDPKPVVFCPPLAVFSSGRGQAREQDVTRGLTLSVELDQDPQQARKRLEELLGPATVVARSGGVWTDPQTGAQHDKLHAHWRLARPAQGNDIARLKRAREIANNIVGGDPTIGPVSHPIRWPGSWHRKAIPRLCAIEALDSDRELELEIALAILLPLARPAGAANGQAGADSGGEGGTDWDELVGNIVNGRNLHASIAALAMKILRAGTNDGAAVNFLRGLLEASSAPKDGRWGARHDDVPRAVSTARQKLDAQASTSVNGDIHWHGQADPITERSWLVQDLVPEIGKGLVSGQWATFKTFTLIELAYCVMTGTPFLGFEIVRRGGVLFVALEGQSEIALRLQGIINHKGGGKPQYAPFAWIETCPPLLAANAVDELGKITDQVAGELKTRFGLPLAMVVIDTMVLAAGYTKDGADNDTVTTNAVLGTMARLAARASCFVFGADHFGKQVETGTRGSSVKEGNADVVLALLADRAVNGAISNCRLALRKRRSGPNGQEFPFKPQVIDMGRDARGKAVTTLVLDWGASVEAPKSRKDDWGKGGGKLLRQIVMSLLAECGIELKPFADGPMVKALKLELVRAEFFKRRYADGDTERAKQQAKRMAFQRAVEAAVDRGVIATREVGGVEYVWLISAHAEMHAHAEE
jgi:AAA domain